MLLSGRKKNRVWFGWFYGASTPYKLYVTKHAFESENQMGNKSGMKDMMVQV